RTQSVDRGDQRGQPPSLVREHLLPPWCEPVVGAAARVVFGRASWRMADEPGLDQRRQMAIEGTGPERHLSARALAYRLHDRVAVAVALGEREQNVEDRGLEW